MIKIAICDDDIQDIELKKREVCQTCEENNIAFEVGISNREDMVFQSLRYQPFRFLRKEYREEELREALLAVVKKMAEEIYLVQLGRERTAKSFPVKDIAYIESSRHYVEVHVGENVYRIRAKISECEKELSAHGFIRVQTGYLVNVRYVACLTSKEVKMDNGDILPVSRRGAEQVKEQYVRNMEKFVNGRYI